jgi:hypothetical protein
MATFSTEIWTRGLDEETIKTSRKETRKESQRNNEKKEPAPFPVPQKQPVHYKIFSDDGSTSWYGRPRRTADSDTESDSDSQSSDVTSDSEASLPGTLNRSVSACVKSNKMNFFHASDSESEPEAKPIRRKPSLFKEFLRAKKPSDSDIEPSPKSPNESSMETPLEKPSLFSSFLWGSRRKTIHSPTSQPDPSTFGVPLNRESKSEVCLGDKYGRKTSILGRGGHAVVKLCCMEGSNEKYAVKEFRKRRRDETKVSKNNSCVFRKNMSKNSLLNFVLVLLWIIAMLSKRWI